MNILMKSAETLKAADMYRMAKSPEIRKMQEADGMVLNMSAYLVYDDEKLDEKSGEIKHSIITSIMNEDGVVFASNSPSFYREFNDMIQLFTDAGEKVNSIKVMSRTSKNGRPFMTCVYNG